MLDRYLALTMAEPATSVDGAGDGAHAHRDLQKWRRDSAANYTKAMGQCTDEATRAAYSCAMNAPNADAWEACID